MNSGSATVGSAIRAVLPKGSNPENSPPGLTARSRLNAPDARQNLELWRDPPAFAPDLFAASAYLCKLGGVLPYFNPSPYFSGGENCQFGLNQEDRRKADDASITWRQTSKFPEFCKDLWKTLTKNWDNPLLPGFYDRVEDCAPEWWKAALTLTMVADMACERILQGKAEKFDTEGPFERMIKWSYLVQEKKAQSKSVEFRPPASLTMVADTSVVCVLPKMRIAPVGATLRNVSRNLSLLPGRGEVRCYWSNIGDTATPSEDNETLDILLIPEPRRIGSIDFVPQANGNRTNKVLHREKWNWDNFDLAQNWIKTEGNRAKFLADCAKLLLKAKRQSRCVNAVILPEYAVDYALFEQICDKLKVIEPRLEFVISGSSNNCHGQSGNMVLTRVWDSQEKPEFHITNSRRKHHRWRMDRRQVEAYALSSALNPKIVNWWENTPLGRRELYFHRFRKASVFSVLICEELARSDPCHEILRSVAPNLIFALLLDGPQIQKRWPAQYASNLADDPGSSVLTFTSYGLIERANLQGHFGPNFSIAMWKDDTGKVVEIPMPQGDGPRGVLLSLWPEHIRDITITGKRSEERAWRYSSHFPIVL